MDMKTESAQARLDGIKSGLQRIRVAFLVTNVAAAAMFISVWNTHFSRAHDFLAYTEISGNPLLAAVQRENAAQTVQGDVVTVALLGIRVRAVDFAVLGSLGMLVCAYWMFLGLRGHYASLAQLLDETREEEAEFRRWVAQAIDSYLVFPALHTGGESTKTKVSVTVNRAFWYIPSLIIALIVCADLHAAFAVREFPNAVSDVFRIARELHPVRFYCLEGGAVMVCLLNALLCTWVARYDTRSDRSLQDYYRQIPAPARSARAGQ